MLCQKKVVIVSDKRVNCNQNSIFNGNRPSRPHQSDVKHDHIVTDWNHVFINAGRTVLGLYLTVGNSQSMFGCEDTIEK